MHLQLAKQNLAKQDPLSLHTIHGGKTRGFVRQVLRYSTCNICWRVRGEVVVLKVKLSVEEGVGEIL